MATCCVPQCTSSSTKMVTSLPQDADLKTRWKQAIQAGTGQWEDRYQNDDVICRLHFKSQIKNDGKPQSSEPSSDHDYQEPTIFVRNGNQIEVASCFMCQTFDTTKSMHQGNTSLRSDQRTLRNLVEKYFSSVTSKLSENQIDEARQRAEKLREAMKKHKVEFEDVLLVEIDIDEHDNMVLNEETGKMEPAVTGSGDSLQGEQDSQDNELEYITNADTDSPLFSEADSTEPEEEFYEELPLQVQNGGHEYQPSRYSRYERAYGSIASVTCYICRENLSTKSDLTYHLRFHHQFEVSYECDLCQKVSPTIYCYNAHLSKHDEAKTIKLQSCNHCEMQFHTAFQRKRHETLRHGIYHGLMVERSIRERNYNCNLCQSRFRSWIDLRRHQIQAHKLNKTKCEICKKKFISPQMLLKHQEKYKTAYGCDLCDFSCHEDTALVEHVEDEHPEKVLKCTSCSKNFGNRSLLEQHNISQAKCRGKMFTLASRRFHGKGTVAVCNLCKMAFERSKEVVSHFDRKHPDETLVWYTCDKCEEIFFTKDSRKTHMRIHADRFCCKECGKPHYKLKCLQSHLRTVHGIMDPLAGV
ncbi:zinc finger protein 28-like isoform X2 [Uranotaenia lowii]|uniref:zinc finger protein 28-like isoform X2 n=1 Tax=Uranotaenia lowii TaxID=190385 RepID=UPI00247A6D03|nr:zinc finger protein 28-like isoform X2 [Uranotaenia lowii]